MVRWMTRSGFPAQEPPGLEGAADLQLQRSGPRRRAVSRDAFAKDEEVLIGKVAGGQDWGLQ